LWLTFGRLWCWLLPQGYLNYKILPILIILMPVDTL
jgi:hypothetical protein